MQVDVSVDGRKRPLSPRLAGIIQWLLLKEPHIIRSQKIQLTFDCAHKNIIAEISEKDQIRVQCK
jgi:hypothetical protein